MPARVNGDGTVIWRWTARDHGEYARDIDAALAVRRVSEGVLQAAGVAEDGCTLGVDTANPQGQNQAAMNHLAFHLRRWQQRAATVPEQVPAEEPIGSTDIP